MTEKNNALIGPTEGNAMKTQMKNAKVELKRLWDDLNKAIKEVSWLGIIDIYGKCWVTDARIAFDAMMDFIVGPGSEGIKGLIQYKRGNKEILIEALSYWTEDQETDFHYCLSEKEKAAIKAKALHVINFIQAIYFKE
jgi:hypothetical protein